MKFRINSHNISVKIYTGSKMFGEFSHITSVLSIGIASCVCKNTNMHVQVSVSI